MTKTSRREYQGQIDRLDAVLRGEMVDGISLESNGITREWCEETRLDLAHLVAIGKFRR